jgi:hypothetical protein
MLRILRERQMKTEIPIRTSTEILKAKKISEPGVYA